MQYIYIYRKHLDILKRDDLPEDDLDKGWQHEILLNNIEAFKEYIANFDKDKIYEYFENKEYRINIKRIILGDKKILDKAFEDTELKAGNYIDLSSRRTDDTDYYNDLYIEILIKLNVYFYVHLILFILKKFI